MTREEVATLKNGQIIYDLWTFHSAAYNGELTRTVISTSSNLETVEVSLGTYRGRSYSGYSSRENVYLTREDAQEAFAYAAAEHLNNEEVTNAVGDVSTGVDRYRTSAREKISLQHRIDEIHKAMQEIPKVQYNISEQDAHSVPGTPTCLTFLDRS